MGGDASTAPYAGPKATRQRECDYALARHNHGKSKVRVLKVRRPTGGRHEVAEYTVNTRLYSDEYAKVFTSDDNSELVATDTQKNAVYVVAKRTDCLTPEQFCVDLATHFLTEYPILSAVEVDVDEVPWLRVVCSGDQQHEHAFVKGSNETASANVRLERSPTGAVGTPIVTSALKGMTVLKTTQSGFAGYHKDKYTLLPECEERCLATELSCYWSYTSSEAQTTGTQIGAQNKIPEYGTVRASVRQQLLQGLFGPAENGIFSPSLQATIYDAGCLALAATPDIATISIETPNLHYLPCHALKVLGEEFEDDVFIPTSEPSGTITCTVTR